MKHYKYIIALFSVLAPLAQSELLSSLTSSEKELIPRILWLDVTVRDSDKDKLFDENTSNIVQKYKQSWNNDNSVKVNKLTTETCGQAIQKIPIRDASTSLLKYATENDSGRHICRIAVLFLYGGYYINKSVDLINPFIEHDEISFAAVVNSDAGLFQEPFLASVPHHALLYRALKRYVMLANGELTLKTASAFGEIMHSSYVEVATVNPNKKSILLLSVHDLNELQKQHDEYKKVSKQDAEGALCNRVAVDIEKKKAYFHILIPNANPSCKATKRSEAVPEIERKSPEVVPKVETTSTSRIPHKLWFISRHQSAKNQLRTTKQKHHDNIQNTIKAYEGVWGTDSVEHKVLDEKACMDAVFKSPIVTVSAKVIDFFKNNNRDIFDFCRAVVLEEHGGYFINEEVEVIVPYTVEKDDIDFVGVLNPNGYFLTSFVAAVPQHPISKDIIKKYLMLAEGKYSFATHYPAWDIYGEAFNVQNNDIKSKSALLKEKNLLANNEYGVKQKDAHICNFIISNPEADTVYFFTRIFYDGNYCNDAEG